MASLTIAGQVFTQPDAIRIAYKAVQGHQRNRLVFVSWRGWEALMPAHDALVIAILVEGGKSSGELG